jgi:hypothetical protein
MFLHVATFGLALSVGTMTLAAAQTMGFPERYSASATNINTGQAGRRLTNHGTR